MTTHWRASRLGTRAESLADLGADRSAEGAGRRPSSLAGGRDRETTAPLGAAPLQDIAAGLRLHPCAKAVRTAAADSAGLIGALHDSSRRFCGWGSRKAHPSQRPSRLSRRPRSLASRLAPFRELPMLRCVPVGFQHRDSVRIRAATPGFRPSASRVPASLLGLCTDPRLKRHGHAEPGPHQTTRRRRLETVSSLLSASTPVASGIIFNSRN